jgi:serine/threonine-protein kinase RsbW
LLTYRDVAMRVVSASCKIFAMDAKMGAQPFQEQLVSAFGEAFNNTVLHAYEGRRDGRVTIEIERSDVTVEIRLIDDGESFDLEKVPTPELDELPESGMGLFIIRSFVDDVSYRAGPPNVLRLTKRL